MIWRMENVNKCKNNEKEKNIEKDGKIWKVCKMTRGDENLPKGWNSEVPSTHIKSMWFQSYNKKKSHKLNTK